MDSRAARPRGWPPDSRAQAPPRGASASERRRSPAPGRRLPEKLWPRRPGRRPPAKPRTGAGGAARRARPRRPPPTAARRAAVRPRPHTISALIGRSRVPLPLSPPRPPGPREQECANSASCSAPPPVAQSPQLPTVGWARARPSWPLGVRPVTAQARGVHFPLPPPGTWPPPPVCSRPPWALTPQRCLHAAPRTGGSTGDSGSARHGAQSQSPRKRTPVQAHTPGGPNLDTHEQYRALLSLTQECTH